MIAEDGLPSSLEERLEIESSQVESAHDYEQDFIQFKMKAIDIAL